jgi:poly(hydroxyalkanoate) depolymerase family esterase
MDRHRLALVLIAWIAVAQLSASPARAASLQKVEQATWSAGGLPSYVNMYIYVPDKLALKPPILVASHHCGGSSTSTFNETKSSFVSLADKNGFLIIFPEATGHNCWDVGSAKSLAHDGGGDTHAIAQMVRHALSKYAGDPSRVYAFGTSSGAMMTEALLGVYPDIFLAGVSVAGVPCGCWAEQYSGDSGANPQWSGPCAGGNVSKTAQEWGKLVRSMFPGYMGHRPRVQLWHGTADTTISFNNLGESIKEWSNVLGLSETPSATDMARSGYTHQTWKSACGFVSLESWAQQGAGHNVSWDAAGAAAFLGLDRSAGQDPETVACPGATGASGADGAIGSAGSQGSRGVAGSASGAGGSFGGGAAGTAGVTASAGTDRPAGAAASGGMRGIAAAGGATAIIAGTGSDGGPGGAGTSSAGSATRVGGVGVAGSVPETATSSTPTTTRSASGCSIVVGARGTFPESSFTTLLLGIIAALARQRRQRD